MRKSLGPDTLPFPAPVWVIGTYDAQGRPNVMTAAWAGICCSRPPCVAVSLRKATYSYGSIVARQAYTVSIPSEEQVRAADYIGLVSGRREDKFARLGLTPVRSELVDAPYVAEFPVVFECRVLRTVEIGLQTQFIGEVLDVKVDEAVLSADGRHPDPEKARPFVMIDGYRGLGRYIGEPFAIGKELRQTGPGT